ncbi:MAG: hypothetical protein V4760_03790 [Bdellovibrionota bacterium]
MRRLHRFAPMAIFATALLIASFAEAMVCRDLFKPSLHLLTTNTVETLVKDVETASDRISWRVALDRATGKPFAIDRRDLDGVIRNAAQLLMSQGARVKAVRHQGFAALEIVPDASARPGWNKMAASLLRTANARLLFAPATLAKYGSRAHLQERFDGGRVIMISRESLKRGRGDYLTAEEMGHAASGARALTDPHPFTGAIETFDPTLRPAIAQGTNSHRDQMTFDESVRSAKNFVRLARELEQGGGVRARRELVVIAKNARDVIKVTRVAVEDVRAITRSMIVGAEGSGFSMSADGTPKTNSAFVYAEGDRQVYVEAAAPGVVRLNLEGNGVDVEIFVRDPQGSLASLIPGLQAENSNTIRQFQTRLPGVVNEWARAQEIAITGLTRSITAVATSRIKDDKTLAREVRAAATAIGPLTARTRR